MKCKNLDRLFIDLDKKFTYACKKKVIFDRVNDKSAESFSVKLVFIHLEVSSYNLS